MPFTCSRRYALVAAAAFLSAGAPAALGQPRRPDPPAITPACIVPPELAHFDLPLPRAARRMAARQPLKIVAIGSSSTYGEGASTPEWSYPSRLRLELAYRFPNLNITVVNRGVNGDNDYDKRSRFERDVVAEKPDVVLWQLGTNSMLHGNPLEKHIAVLRGGVEHLRKATNADIILIDPQYAPKVIRGAGANSIIAMIAETARLTNVNLFRRYELMRRWREVEQLAFDKFISPDELHMNDWSYACVARALGTAIADASTLPAPIPSAQGAPPSAARQGSE
jgi:lysophospholipase L1-like esterase